MTTIITHDPDEGCAACPFGYRERTWWCAALPTHKPAGNGVGPAPSWCPLRSGPVVVRRKEA